MLERIFKRKERFPTDEEYLRQREVTTAAFLIFLQEIKRRVNTPQEGGRKWTINEILHDPDKLLRVLSEAAFRPEYVKDDNVDHAAQSLLLGIWSELQKKDDIDNN